MVYTPVDLEPIEIALLGVMCAGLPPSRAARDDTFRVDHVTAVVHSLQMTGDRTRYLAGDGSAVLPAFRSALRAAIARLTELGIVASQPADMPIAAGGFDSSLEVDLVNPDEHPAVLDRQLAQECMEVLFNVAAVYPYLMERYAASGEIWRRLNVVGAP